MSNPFRERRVQAGAELRGERPKAMSVGEGNSAGVEREVIAQLKWSEGS